MTKKIKFFKLNQNIQQQKKISNVQYEHTKFQIIFRTT